LIYYYTNIYGDTYLPYLRSLLVSIKKLLQGDSIFIVFFDNISDWEILILQEVFPFVKFISDDLVLLESKSIHHLIANKSKAWSSFISSLDNGDRVIFLDVDTVIISSDLNILFKQSEFDIALTIYDNGYILNTGVIYLNVSDRTKYLMSKWSDYVFEIFTRNDRKEIDEINNKYGGVDQFVFCLIGKIDSDKKIGDLYIVNLDNKFDIIFNLLDGDTYNLIKSDNFTPNTKVIHFKSGWRNILNKTSFFNINRKYNTSVVQYGIWHNFYLNYLQEEKRMLLCKNNVRIEITEIANKIESNYSYIDILKIFQLNINKPYVINFDFNLSNFYFDNSYKSFFEHVILHLYPRSLLIYDFKYKYEHSVSILILPNSFNVKKIPFLKEIFLAYFFIKILSKSYKLSIYRLKIIILRAYYSIKK
jgi:hypothetical protein